MRENLYEALKRLRSLFAGDPGGEYVFVRQDGKQMAFWEALIIGEAQEKADKALAAYEEEHGEETQ